MKLVFATPTGNRCCPFCGSGDLQHSKRRTLIEQFFLPMFLLQPYRCNDCHRRHFSFHFLRRATAPRRVVNLSNRGAS